MTRPRRHFRERLTSFPAPRPGEAMLGILTRGYGRYGVDLGSFMDAVVGIQSMGALDPAMPTHAARIAESMPAGHPLSDVEVMLREHTALPYHLFFANEARRRQALSAIADSHTYALHSVLGLSTARLTGIVFPRLCPECARIDKAERACSLYRTEHQLPTTWVCAEHQQLLIDGCEICRSTDKSAIRASLLRMPGRCADSRHSSPHPCTTLAKEEVPDALWFAQQGKCLLERYEDAPPNAHERLRAAVLKKFRRSGGVDRVGLARAIEARFSAAMLRRLGLAFTCDRDRRSGWHFKLLCSHGASKLKEVSQWLAVIGVMYRDVEHFIDDAPEVQSAVPAPSRPAWSEDLKNLLGSGKSFDVIRRSLRISFNAALREMREQGWTLPKPTAVKVSEATYNNLIESWNKGTTLLEMASVHGVSAYFLDMMTVWEPGLHARWVATRREQLLERHRNAVIEYVAAHPGASRYEVMKALDGSIEALRERDPEWLDAVLPSRSGSRMSARPSLIRRDWTARDSQFAQQIADWAQRELADDVRPVRITATRALTAIGALTFVYSAGGNRTSFPETRDRLAALVETTEAFRLRRLKWVARQCAAAKLPLKPETIRIAASIHRPAVDRYWSEVVAAYDAAIGTKVAET